MHVLLTGLTGFIARRIAHDLLARGDKVRGTLRDPSRLPEIAALMPEGSAGRLSAVQTSLDADDGWDQAAQGVDALVHTASPFPMNQIVADPETLMRPAVAGTMRAMRAARDAGVSRVILTSSAVAIANSPDPGNRPRDESDWSDPDHPASNAYACSKIAAERAAWDFADENGMELTVLNPGLVLGPPLGPVDNTSLRFMARILSGRDPAQPPLNFEVVDVRDVATAHLRALDLSRTAGERFALTAGPMWMTDLARLALAEAPDRRIATREAPRLLLRGMALLDPSVRGILPLLDRRAPISSDKARRVLGIDFIPAPDAARAAIRGILAAEGAG